MAISSFHELASAFGELSGTTPPVLEADEDGVTAFHLLVRGIYVNLAHAAGSNPGAVFLMVGFGPVPPDNEAEVWRMLMDINFLMMSTNAPAFSRDPNSGEVLLQMVVPLENIEVTAFYQFACSQLVDLALRWRSDYFLESTTEDLRQAVAMGLMPQSGEARGIAAELA